MTSELPQYASDSLVFKLGVTVRDFPVQASNAFLCANFQSAVPSNCKIAKVVKGDLVDIRALIGDVEVIFW